MVNTVNAENCKVVKVEEQDEKEFLDKYDELGYCASRICYGLSHNGELLQLISLHYSKDKFSYELIRNCLKEGVSVEDGTKKLFEHIVSKNKIVACVCNLDKGENEYSQLGFYRYGTELVYYPFGVVFKVIDSIDNTNYIGMCENINEWNKGYLGSGTKWKKHLAEHPDRNYKREILFTAKHPLELRLKEDELIKEVINTDDNLNMRAGLQRNKGVEAKICQECGLRGGFHRADCSHYEEVESRCPECLKKNGEHRKDCSHYKQIVCEECGSKAGFHKPFCSHAKKCPECGSADGHHRKHCSHYKILTYCPECHGERGKHRKGCSKYEEQPRCEFCGNTVQNHSKDCPLYKPRKACEFCGSRGGSHRKGCPLYKEKVACEFCGSLGNTHRKGCKYYKEPEVFSCCGGRGTHRKGCPEYKSAACPHCHRTGGWHNEDCPKYTVCPECGSPRGHRRGCSQRKQCPECLSYGIRHKKSCSHYKEPKKCPECLSSSGHKKSCSHYKPRATKITPCPICGGKSNKHYKSCPKYKQPVVCPECLTPYNHKKSCSHYKEPKSE